MPRIDDEDKRNRLERIFLLLTRNARGLTEAEIADEIRLERRTVNNYLRELEFQGKAFKDGLYWFPLALKESKLRSFDLSPEEAVTLYLGARLLSKQQDKRNEPAETALLKLASVLKADAGVGAEIEQAARELAQRPIQKDYQPIFRDVVRGYIYRKKIEIAYRPLNWNKSFQTTFSTYLLEPSPIGFTTYLIGHSSIVNAQRAYKLERIESVRLTKEEYSIPPDFPGLEILRSAWSIVMGEETVRVLLRFRSETAKARVLETRWHPSQQPYPDPENPEALLLEFKVADTLDLIPWIRSWGADVEALEPEELREALEREVKKMAKVYGVDEIKSEEELIAHVRQDGKEQSLIAHLTEASQLAEGFAAKVGLPEIGKIMGLLHDFGKASREFQEYLRSATGRTNPDEDEYVDYEAKKGKIDHSTAGAQLAFEKLAGRGQEGKILAQFLALAIASHHSGLIDCLTPSGDNKFEERIAKIDEKTHLTEARSKLPDIEKQLDGILAQPIEKHFYQVAFETMTEAADSKDTRWFKRGLLARFLFSCLLEADRLNTADFENPGNEAVRNYGKYIPWDTLIERLEVRYAEYAQKTAQMQPGRALEVNQLRAQVAQACLETAGKPKGIYQLTVPTGGGKTEASLRFALHHARAHTNDQEKIERIFYVVPYITIIDQNADKVREILEKADEPGKVVLEHHSNFVPSEDTRRRHNLLAENWDAPIVFTTQVQFLEALFGYGTRDARRMHQLANSVIIFDEVQTIPIKITHMFATALRFLTRDCGATVVLCTATQPPLDKLPNEYRKLTIESEYKIIQNEPELFKKLKRVEVHDERKPGGLTNAEIADLAEHALREKGSVLIVVNTRASAKALYEEIKGRQLGAETYHLSTNMCPAHRMDVLENEIKPKLEAKEPVICVSTQLIEAGVDIDFGAVIRALAGLDSIAQSAGRCNRHGKHEDGGDVWVVNPQEENLDKLKDIQVGREHAQRVLDDFRETSDDFGNDRIGLDAVAKYYDFYYHSQKDQMNYPVGASSSVGRNDDLFSLLSQNKLSSDAYTSIHHAAPDILLRQSFRTANGEFRVIDSLTRGVIVPYKDGKKIITELCGAFGLEKQGKLLKQAQRYSVNLFQYQFDQLFKAGAIKEVQEDAGIYHLNEQYYSEEFGWSDKPASGMEVLIK
ncbi:MAG: CRISPR-associated helicase Cas3' [Chloroflexi bacterium]|nr:CRISPR-associated helicase Cas3' [Chloroflexota bacterium]